MQNPLSEESGSEEESYSVENGDNNDNGSRPDGRYVNGVNYASSNNNGNFQGSTGQSTSSSNKESSPASNYGFEPMESEQHNEQNAGNDLKRKRVDDSPEALQMRSKINRLILRYPGLVLRSSFPMMEKLSSYDYNELTNIYTNAHNDIRNARKNQCADLLLIAGTYHMNKKYPTFTSRCIHDIELKRDIEMEVVGLLTFLENKIHIFLGLATHLFRAMTGIETNTYYEMMNHPLYAPQTQQEHFAPTSEAQQQGSESMQQQNNYVQDIRLNNSNDPNVEEFLQQRERQQERND